MSNWKYRGLLVASVVAFGALLCGWVGSGVAAEPAGRLVSASGPVEIRQLGQRVWHVATVQRVLQPGDVLRTGPGGAAEVALVDGVFRLDENTVVVLPAPDSVSVAADVPQGVRVFLYGGRALFKVFKERLQRGFEILTPSVVVGVKGTTFGVEQGPNLGVLVFEGTVEVAQRGRPDLSPVMVGAGQFTELFRGRLTPPRPFDRGRPGPLWNGASTRVQSDPLPLSPLPDAATGPRAPAADADTPSETNALTSLAPSTAGEAGASREMSAGASGDESPSKARKEHPAHPLGGPPGQTFGGPPAIGAGGGAPGLGGGTSAAGFLPPGLGPLGAPGQIKKHKN